MTKAKPRALSTPARLTIRKNNTKPKPSAINNELVAKYKAIPKRDNSRLTRDSIRLSLLINRP